MRLIDADELIKSIEQSRNNNPHKDCHVKRNHDIEHNHFIKMVHDQPTAFDKERVINDLISESICSSPDEDSFVELEEAIEIIEKGGIEWAE